MSEHTPTPWYLPDGDANAVLCGDKNDPEIIAMLEGDDPMFVQDGEQMEANARLIVRAVNSHDTFVAELRMALVTLDVVWKEHNPKNVAAKCCATRIRALLEGAQ